jgi:peptidoglycan/xylan/chitin deacetylase (PgdA/CDA1 family)
VITALAAHSMRRPRHLTLIFHRILDQVDPMSPDEPTTAWFRGLVRMLARHFEPISLGEALDRAAVGRLSGRTLSITFDDGYADNFTNALPVLEEFGVPATFFVASGFLDGGRMWNDTIIETIRRLAPGRYELEITEPAAIELSDWASRRSAASRVITAWKHLPPAQRQAKVDGLAALAGDLPDDLMMTGAQLRALAGSAHATVGGHTRFHPILASITDAEAAAEIEAGKRDLEALLQRELTLFAYPNGKLERDYRAAHRALVERAGFRAAVATDWGTLDASTDAFAIPRFTPWQRNLGRFALDLARCHHGML